MFNRKLQFPHETYTDDGRTTDTEPNSLPDVRKNLHKVCLPNDNDEYRRYAIKYDNELPTYGPEGITDPYTLGAIACPTLLKCENCPLQA